MTKSPFYKYGLCSLALSFSLVSLLGCSKESPDQSSSNNSDALFFSFHTPDWSERIDCTHLDLDARNTGFLTARSQSTNEQFYLEVPRDSSEWTNEASLKRYPIGDGSVFQFNQSLPITKGASTRLAGIPQFTDSSYNEITALKYLNSDTTGAYFLLKAKYRMMMEVASGTSPDAPKFVYGEYTFKVKTRKQ